MADGRKQDDKDTEDQSLGSDGAPRGGSPAQSSATDWDMNRTKPSGGPRAAMAVAAGFIGLSALALTRVNPRRRELEAAPAPA